MKKNRKDKERNLRNNIFVISTEYPEYDNERISLLQKLNIQRIIARPDYFEEIKRIEESLTDIILSNEEEEIVNLVVSHPKLEGVIDCHGINLIEGYY